MKSKFLLLSFSIFLLLQSYGIAQTTIAQWLTDGVTGYGPATLAPTTANPNLTITGVTRFNASTSGTAASNAWGGSGWNAGNGFVEFSFAANTGFELSLASLVLQNRRSGTGPSSGNLTYSLSTDGGTTFGSLVSITTLNFPANTGSGGVLPTVDLSTIAALQNLGSGTVVRFRIALAGATSSAGTWYIIGNEGLRINGTVNPVSIAPPTSANAASVCAGEPLTLRIQGATNNYRVYDAATAGNLIAQGDSVLVLNNILSSTSLFISSFNGSIESTLRLEVRANIRPISRDTLRRTICAGSSFNFANVSYRSSIIVSDTAANANGCDSITTLALTVNPPLRDTLRRIICAGSSFNFANVSYRSSIIVSDTLSNANGCDSIITLALTVSPPLRDTISRTICAGSSFTFNNTALRTAGTYIDTLSTTAGCDSILTLNLQVLPILRDTVSRTICSGTPFFFNSIAITRAGVYIDTISNASGCDSITVLTLRVNQRDTTQISITTCDSEPYRFNNRSLNVSGIYFDTLSNVLGCDSLLILNLRVNEGAQTRLFRTICANESFSFDGNFIRASGVYRDTLNALNTCDSIVILSLTVEPPVATPIISASLRNDSLQTFTPAESYRWLLNNIVIPNERSNRIAIRANGAYSVIAVATNTCESDTSASFVVTNAVALQEFANPKVFPTSFREELNIGQLNQAMPHTFKLYTLQGTLVYTASLNAEVKLSVPTLPKGIYFAEISNNKGLRYIQRLVKE